MALCAAVRYSPVPRAPDRKFPCRNPVAARAPGPHNARMSLSRQIMLREMLAANAAFDGRFITGVVSTGIYCLPSCRAKKPKPENVVFHATPASARSAGLRPCLRCHPDHYYAGIHADEAQVAALAALPPGDLPDVPALARAAGLSVRALHALLREHLGLTPADFLARGRIAQARHLLLHTDRPVTEIAFEVGFASLSAFGEQFRKQAGLSAQAYRDLRGAQAFTLRLPAGYPLAAMLRDLSRDRCQSTARVEGHTLHTALRLPGGVQVVHVALRAGQAEVTTGAPLSPADAAALHGMLRRMLGLTSDPARFERLARQDAAFGPLVAGTPGYRVPLTPTPFDALVWAVAGQQVTFAFACTLRRRLCDRLAEPAGAGLSAPPSAEGIAALSIPDLTALGFTRARADLLSRVAGLCASGALHLDALAGGSVRAAERQLTAVPGIGPWTARYVLLRGLGAADVVPVGDSALAAGLQQLHGLPARPDARQVTALLAPLAPYRSLATLHVWRHHAALKETA